MRNLNFNGDGNHVDGTASLSLESGLDEAATGNYTMRYMGYFWIHPLKWSFWYRMKGPIFLITPVKYDMQVATDVDFKVTSENVAKVQKLL